MPCFAHQCYNYVQAGRIAKANALSKMVYPVVQGAVALKAPEEQANGALRFGEVDRFDGRIVRPEGWHHHPPEAPLAFLPDPGHEDDAGVKSRIFIKTPKR
jgi:hypothetical protein